MSADMGAGHRPGPARGLSRERFGLSGERFGLSRERLGLFGEGGGGRLRRPPEDLVHGGVSGPAGDDGAEDAAHVVLGRQCHAGADGLVQGHVFDPGQFEDGVEPGEAGEGAGPGADELAGARVEAAAPLQVGRVAGGDGDRGGVEVDSGGEGDQVGGDVAAADPARDLQEPRGAVGQQSAFQVEGAVAHAGGAYGPRGQVLDGVPPSPVEVGRMDLQVLDGVGVRDPLVGDADDPDLVADDEPFDAVLRSAEELLVDEFAGPGPEDRVALRAGEGPQQPVLGAEVVRPVDAVDAAAAGGAGGLEDGGVADLGRGAVQGVLVVDEGVAGHQVRPARRGEGLAGQELVPYGAGGRGRQSGQAEFGGEAGDELDVAVAPGEDAPDVVAPGEVEGGLACGGGVEGVHDPGLGDEFGGVGRFTVGQDDDVEAEPVGREGGGVDLQGGPAGVDEQDGRHAYSGRVW
ncbi:hypothetical protein OG401_40420 [Kitasatospora purpeofusca]|nr:hypothetical protein [Kitasatospora purpeofusca]MCX4690489.1 hypothetical protein [Kitasatospora purpeofusca]